MQRNENYSKGQKIFIGIDVHKKNWAVAIIPEVGRIEQFVQPADANALFEHLTKHYSGCAYYAVYESGFSGFSTYYSLSELGINCIVVNASDVPTTQYETVMKTDRVDAAKLARSLKAGLLRGIYVRERQNIDDRSVVRGRKTIQSNLCAYKIRVKHLLMSNGVALPERFEKTAYHWPRALVAWLASDEARLLSDTRVSLDQLLDVVKALRLQLLAANRRISRLSKEERYADRVERLTGIPGIGVLTAMCILTEIYDVSRFRNERQFASYLGLIPTSHSSGEKIVHGEKTFRGNKQLGPIIVEAAWVAVSRDIKLGNKYVEYKKTMSPQEAIIRIARKMSNIIFTVLKNGKKYDTT